MFAKDPSHDQDNEREQDRSRERNKTHETTKAQCHNENPHPKLGFKGLPHVLLPYLCKYLC